MKRSDRDEEVSPVIKEPRLESQELRTSSSSSTEQLQGACSSSRKKRCDWLIGVMLIYFNFSLSFFDRLI